jgi:hypothetical protein
VQCLSSQCECHMSERGGIILSLSLTFARNIFGHHSKLSRSAITPTLLSCVVIKNDCWIMRKEKLTFAQKTCAQTCNNRLTARRSTKTLT